MNANLFYSSVEATAVYEAPISSQDYRQYLIYEQNIRQTVLHEEPLCRKISRYFFGDAQ